MDLESIEKLFALMRDHGVLRFEHDGMKVELGENLPNVQHVVLPPVESPERAVAGGPQKPKGTVNPLLRHKSLGLDLELEVPVAP